MRSIWFGPFGHPDTMNTLKLIPEGMVFVKKKNTFVMTFSIQYMQSTNPRSLEASKCLGGIREAITIKF